MMSRTLIIIVTTLVGAGWAAAEEAVTMETCAVCHDEVAAAFASGAHGRAMQRADPAVLAGSCVACHGPAAEHVDDPNTENIVRRPGQDACLSCHPGFQGLTDTATAAHVRNAVACGDCHGSGHQALATDHLLLAPSHELCAGCHTSVAGSFKMPFAHRDGARPFECSSCHSVHGLGRLGGLTMIGSGGACLDCHADKTGPFVYPHPPQQLDGCVTCHAPHGSPNPRLLTRNRVAALCIECHTNVPRFHDLSSARYQSCQTCHAAVHGSNRDPALFEE